VSLLGIKLGITAAMLVFALGALPAASRAASPGAVAGTVRVAEPSAPKWMRKLLDYAGCIGAITLVHDANGALGAMGVCSSVLKTWYDE